MCLLLALLLEEAFGSGPQTLGFWPLMSSRDLPWSAGMAGSVTTHRRQGIHPSPVTEGRIPHFEDAEVGREGKVDWNCLSCLDSAVQEHGT